MRGARKTPAAANVFRSPQIVDTVLELAAPLGRERASDRVWWSRFLACVVEPAMGSTAASERAAARWCASHLQPILHPRTWQRLQQQIENDPSSCWKGVLSSESGSWAAGHVAAMGGVGAMAQRGDASTLSLSLSLSLATEEASSSSPLPLTTTRVTRCKAPSARGWQASTASVALPATGAGHFRWSLRVTAGATAVMSGLCFARADVSQVNLHNSADAVAFCLHRSGGIFGKMPGSTVRGVKAWGGAKRGDVVGFRFDPQHGTLHAELNGVEVATHIAGIGGARNRLVFDNCVRLRAFVALCSPGTTVEVTTPASVSSASASALASARPGSSRDSHSKGGNDHAAAPACEEELQLKEMRITSLKNEIESSEQQLRRLTQQLHCNGKRMADLESANVLLEAKCSSSEEEAVAGQSVTAAAASQRIADERAIVAAREEIAVAKSLTAQTEAAASLAAKDFEAQLSATRRKSADATRSTAAAFAAKVEDAERERSALEAQLVALRAELAASVAARAADADAARLAAQKRMKALAAKSETQVSTLRRSSAANIAALRSSASGVETELRSEVSALETVVERHAAEAAAESELVSRRSAKQVDMLMKAHANAQAHLSAEIATRDAQIAALALKNEEPPATAVLVADPAAAAPATAALVAELDEFKARARSYAVQLTKISRQSKSWSRREAELCAQITELEARLVAPARASAPAPAPLSPVLRASAPTLPRRPSTSGVALQATPPAKPSRRCSRSSGVSSPAEAKPIGAATGKEEEGGIAASSSHRNGDAADMFGDAFLARRAASAVKREMVLLPPPPQLDDDDNSDSESESENASDDDEDGGGLPPPPALSDEEDESGEEEEELVKVEEVEEKQMSSEFRI